MRVEQGKLEIFASKVGKKSTAVPLILKVQLKAN